MSPLVLLWLAVVPAEAPIDTAVVCPSEFRAALAPWIAYREAQGHRMVVLTNRESADDLRATIRRTAEKHPIKYLVLVGDAQPITAREAPQTTRSNSSGPAASKTSPKNSNEVTAARSNTVPTHHAQAVVNVRWGSEPLIATDNWYADLDDDRVPELAVGRLTADTPAELEAMVAKILAYEQCDDYGGWRRRVNFIAGLGGFGPVADAVLEAAAKTLITSGVPPAYATTMTYSSWQSPYCPDPRDFGRVTLERLNEGSLFWVYIGHGQERSLDVVQVPGGAYPILACRDTQRLACRHGAPIACFLACYAGAFDKPQDCLAEELLRAPGGPVAIVAGTRVTMPYAMATLGTELLRECFENNPPTIGAAIVAAKRRTMQPAGDSQQRVALDALGKTFNSAGDLEAERAEHLDLFHLFGDPLMRLPQPRPIQLEVRSTAAAGQSLQVRGTSPVSGACTIELVVRRDRLTFQPQPRSRFDSSALAAYDATYRRANEPRLATVTLDRVEGTFDATLTVPPEARGACHVRVFVEGLEACAAGAADVRLEGSATARREGEQRPQ
jgi:hypothetical protein